jgi:hypothetical protein
MAYDSVPERKQGHALAIGATVWTMQAAGLALLDAIALGMSEPSEGPSVIQERAYSSAIWFTP